MSRRSKKNSNKTLAYFNLVKESKMAVQLTLKEGDVSDVWFPLSKVNLNKECMIISGPKRFMEGKVAESKVAVNVEKLEAAKKARDEKNNAMMVLKVPNWNGDKSVGINCIFWVNARNREENKMVFFVKSKMKDGCVPQWMITSNVNSKMDEINADHVISGPTV